MGIKTIKFFAIEIILALEYLHSKNIIHKDLKSENILISDQGNFKLIYFGLSDVYLKAEDSFNLSDEDISEIKVEKIHGTIHYMAPEMINGDSITKAVDYWALGVILYLRAILY